MVYIILYIVREEILLIAFFYPIPSGLIKILSNSWNIRAYNILKQRKLCIYAYDDIRN